MQQCKDYATSLWAKSNCHNSLKICHSLQAFSVMFWLFARDNEQIVLTYFRWPWLCTYERICRIMRYHLMEQVLLQRSAKINVFPEFKPTLMNHTSNTVDKILTIIVGLIFFISFQALVLANCPLFSWTNFEAALKRSSLFAWWAQSKTSNALFGDKLDFKCPQQRSNRPDTLYF